MSLKEQIQNVSKLNNVERLNSLLDYIKELGYTPIDIKTGDGYLASVEEGSTAVFTIKEFPKYRFGVWQRDMFDDPIQQIIKTGSSWAESLNVSINSELVLFIQHSWFIDKFKPSRGSWVTGLYRQKYQDGNQEVERWQSECELADKLEFIKKHPIKSQYYISADIDGITGEVSGIKALIEYIKDFYEHYKWKYKDWYQVHKLSKKAIKFVKKLTQFQSIVSDVSSYQHPPVEILLRRNKVIDTEKYKKELNRIYNFYDKELTDIDIMLIGFDIADKIIDNPKAKVLEQDKDDMQKFSDLAKYRLKERKEGKVIYEKVEEDF